MQSTSRACVLAWLAVAALPLVARAQRPMEEIDRGVVAIHQGEGKVFVGWRLLTTDPKDATFNVYRASGAGAAAKLNDQPLAGPTHFTDAKPDLAQPSVYTVRVIVNGKEQL